MGGNFIVELGVGMNKAVLPKVNVEAPVLKIGNKLVWIGVLITPLIGAGVGVGMPARLKTDNVAGNVAVSEIVGSLFYLFGVPLIVATVKQTQRPFGNLGATACQHIVLAYNIGYGAALNHIYINTCRRGDSYAHN